MEGRWKFLGGMSLFFFVMCVDLNVSSSEVIGNFGTVVNAGNFSQPSDSDEIDYQATVRASNESRNKNGQALFLGFGVVVDGVNQTYKSRSLQVSDIQHHKTFLITSL